MTKVNRILLYSCDILCNCNEVTILDEDANVFLYESFSSLGISSTILKEILPHFGEYAREMIINNDEDHSKWEINVTLDVIRWYNEDHDDVASLFNVNMLKKVGMDDSFCYATNECPICLEEFLDRTSVLTSMFKCQNFTSPKPEPLLIHEEGVNREGSESKSSQQEHAIEEESQGE
ncbi:hypothetical protein KIW84_023759 [Lathyrus oleraceus]|uniref:Uncharacterized protein n=1 Tax=Pisum sativum TaxID=3888 RepID=A0A9D4YFT7_PEA|nr:hypothetical protein KIW84_023759 [Pisum sativum]